MNAHEFNKRVIGRQLACRDILMAKAVEYAGDKDRLESFKRAAKIQGITPAGALLGMMAKHWVSIAMMIDQDKYGDGYGAMWSEKITDTINYLHLLECVLVDMIGKDAVQLNIEEYD
jgi:hypothetical protein